jgi:chromosome segregation ATPase
MNRITIILSAAAMAILTAGCYKGSVDVGSDNRQAPPPSSTAQQPDNRPAAEIQRENAQLRPRLEKFEKDFKDWTAAVESKKDEINELKRQRKDIEKDRDRWKKAAKGD